MVNPILGEQRIDKLRFHVHELTDAVENLIHVLKEHGYDNEILFHKHKKAVEKARQDLYGKAAKGGGISKVEEQVRSR
jgi:hypothetical protein